VRESHTVHAMSITAHHYALKPYPIWPGFALIVLLIGVELKDASDEETVNLLTHVKATLPPSDAYWILSILILIYYLMCVYRFHSVLRQQTEGDYPIKPPEAAFFHLVPLLNLYWVFAWPSRFAGYVNAERAIKVIPGAVCGCALILSALISKYFDTAVGMAGLFLVTAYLTNRLRHYVGYRELDRAAAALENPA
jgi:hypothetical protein